MHLDQIRHLEGVFQQFLLPGKETMCQEEFCKMIGSKNVSENFFSKKRT